MEGVSARRAFLLAVRWRRPEQGAGEPPVFWGRVGAYEGVTRRGILLLLSPEPAHPSLRVKNGV
jgi:hypothetical protein